MAWPQTLMIAYMLIGVIADTYAHKDSRCKAFWAGRIIGHMINIAFVSFILHLGWFYTELPAYYSIPIIALIIAIIIRGFL